VLLFGCLFAFVADVVRGVCLRLLLRQWGWVFGLPLDNICFFSLLVLIDF